MVVQLAADWISAGLTLAVRAIDLKVINIIIINTSVYNLCKQVQITIK